jgi:hypothetical protein
MGNDKMFMVTGELRLSDGSTAYEVVSVNGCALVTMKSVTMKYGNMGGVNFYAHHKEDIDEIRALIMMEEL